jgi:hypothetical protein
MPFKSEKQRKWMWANDPEMAQKWEDEEKELASEEQIDEALKPEVSTKAKEIFKTMISDRGDELLNRYKSGIKAEQIAMWTAIKNAKNKAKKQTEEKPEEEMEDGKLKEMVRAALMNPITEKTKIEEKWSGGVFGILSGGLSAIKKFMTESPESAREIRNLEPILKDILKAIQQVDSSQDDTEDDVEELDKSIDYLSAAITGKSPLSINVDQDILGRLAQPPNEEVYEWKRDLDEDSNINEGYDAVANKLYGVNYDELSPQEQEYVRDKIDKERGVMEDLDVGNIDENIDSKILAHLKSEKDPTDESKPFDIDKLVNVKKTDRGNYEVYYLTNSGKKEGILVYQYEIDKMKKKNIDENSLLKEYTMHGGDYSNSYANRPPEEQLTTDENYQEFAKIFPKGAFSRILVSPDRKQDFDKHMDWTRQSDYNNTFVHVQYHKIEHDGNDYFVHQTQYYNHNYDDFRSPGVTKLYIVKNSDTEDEEKLGTYLVDTNEYVKDLKNLNIKKRVSEGTCGYSIDGKGDNKPAGPHLLKKKIKEIIQNKIKNMNENKPSSGLSKKQKSSVAKKARSGKDIGDKGKDFDKVAAKAAKEYGSKEAGEKVAAAAMWKNVKRKKLAETIFAKLRK